MPAKDDSSIGVRFGFNLRSERCRQGLSQHRLGEAAGLHRTAIGMIEKGERVPRVDTTILLAKAPTITPLELLKGIA
jgi:DNA-binding XRE family transcriptional regulator